ncbi:MAG: hypothetical protein ABWY09_01625 [Stenotrophomonas maltophilia]
MSAPVDALAGIDRNLKDRAERAARYGRKADKEASRRGFRNEAGDRKAEFERLLLQQLSEARAAVAELIAADLEYDAACIEVGEAMFGSREQRKLAAERSARSHFRRIAALARVQGGAA